MCVCVCVCVCSVLVAQSCLTLPSSSVHGVFQARRLEWLAISSLGDFSDPGIKPKSPALQTDSLPSEPAGKPLEVWDPDLKKDKKRNRDLVTKYEVQVWTISQK